MEYFLLICLTLHVLLFDYLLITREYVVIMSTVFSDVFLCCDGDFPLGRPGMGNTVTSP